MCPPVLSINAGSLGFLCPFDFENYKNYLNGVIKGTRAVLVKIIARFIYWNYQIVYVLGNVPILYRNRLKFKLEKSTSSGENDTHHEEPEVIIGIEEIDSLRENEETQVKNISSPANDDIIPLECLSLNEIIISRGANSYLSNLDLYINDYLITTVQGDGLIVSTPTGSTAYAMAAGASMCHPSVAAMVIAPICPHSLSFRPIVVPMGVKLKIALNVDARTTEASCSIDGRVNTKLRHEWHVSITASEHPVPFICRSDQINEWFEGLASCLHWVSSKNSSLWDIYYLFQTRELSIFKNDRPRQLPLNSGFISKSRSPSRSRSHSSFSSAYAMSSSTSSLSTSVAHQQLAVPPCLSCPSCPNLINEHYDTDSEAVVFAVKCCEDIKEWIFYA